MPGFGRVTDTMKSLHLWMVSFSHQTATPAVNGHRAHPQGMLLCILQCSSMDKMLSLTSLVWKWPCLEELLSDGTTVVHEHDSTGYVCLENEDFSQRQNKEQLLSDAGSASSLPISKRSLKNMSKRHLKICLFSGLFLDSETPETLLTFF